MLTGPGYLSFQNCGHECVRGRLVLARPGTQCYSGFWTALPSCRTRRSRRRPRGFIRGNAYLESSGGGYRFDFATLERKRQLKRGVNDIIPQRNDKLASLAYPAFVLLAWKTALCVVAAVFNNRGFSGTLKTRPSALTRSMSGLGIRSHRDAVAQSNSGSTHQVSVTYFGDAGSKVAVKLRFAASAESKCNGAHVARSHASFVSRGFSRHRS